MDVIDAVAHEGTVQGKAVSAGVVLDACLGKGLVDGKLCGHDGVISGGEDGLDTGGDEGLSGHLNFGGGGAVLLDVLDALAVAESLGVCNGLCRSILAQIIQQADGVDVGVDGQDEVHDGVGVQGIGSAGDVRLGVKACGGGVGDGGVDDGDVGILHSGQHGSSGGGGHSHDDVHAVGHEVGADLVQVGLVGLRIGVVVGVVEGDALLLAHLVQTLLHRRNDLVQGSVVNIVDNAHLEGLACLAGGGRRCCCTGSGAGCSARSGRTAAGQTQRGNGSGGHGGFQKAAAGDPVHGFHSGCSFPGAGGM